MRRFEARGVSVRLGGVQALDDVSLELEAGRAVMLIGPNGAGKSTLLKVLLGLVRPDSATFRIDGERVAIDNDWKRRVGYLPEAAGFSENLSGRQLTQFFARARGVRRGRVDEVLERIGLARAARRAIRGYSRGMRQRLGLGVAILANPELLILDEPTAGLDQEGLSVLWAIIAEWRESRRMVLASTHDLALMERRMDEIHVLRAGCMLARGTAESLRQAAGLPHRIWLEVESQSDARVTMLCEALSRWGRASVERVEDRIRVEVPQDAVLDLMKLQSGFPGLVVGIRVEEPTLDVVYGTILGAA